MFVTCANPNYSSSGKITVRRAGGMKRAYASYLILHLVGRGYDRRIFLKQCIESQHRH